MKDYHWCVCDNLCYDYVEIQMSILMPTQQDVLEFPDAMHESEIVVLPLNEDDNDSDLDSCDNVD